MTDVAIALTLVALAIVISFTKGMGLEKDLVIATVRGAVQLAAVAALIDVVFERLGWAVVLLVVMVALASWTSARRMKGVPRAPLIALIVITTSSVVALLVLFGAGVFEFEPRFLIPIAGMIIGNAMIATSLAGSRLRDEFIDKTLEIEARLALGVKASEAVHPYTRRAGAQALVPIIDTTKNVGLIHLPGAFVGMILAGASPADATVVQLVVLFMLLGAIAVAGMLTPLLVSRSFIATGERIVIPAAS
jgi:putative ABC transport system permease protein